MMILIDNENRFSIYQAKTGGWIIELRSYKDADPERRIAKDGAEVGRIVGELASARDPREPEPPVFFHACPDPSKHEEKE